MALVDPAARDGFAADLSAADELGAQRVIVATQKDKRAAWSKWSTFCHELALTPFLDGVPEAKRIDFFLVFAMRYRRDAFTRLPRPREKPIGAKRVSAVLQAVGENFTRVGQQDPRLANPEKIGPPAQVAPLLLWPRRPSPRLSMASQPGHPRSHACPLPHPPHSCQVGIL